MRKWLRRWIAPFPYEDYVDRHRCIFIHIPKCAGSSVHAVLGGGRKVSRSHASYRMYQTADRRRFASYFKFTVVRNPWERALSSYRYLATGGSGREADLRLSAWINAECGDFRDFVLKWLDHDKLHGILVLRPQFSFVYDMIARRVMVDQVCRMERLEADLESVWRRLGVHQATPMVNASIGDKPTDAYADPAVVDRVATLYALDAKLFDYRFDAE
jgi:hypothetical protein